MAFLTGVDLLGRERRAAEEEDDKLALVRRRPSPSPVLGGQHLELLDQEEPVEYGTLLKRTLALNDEEDPLEELRRMIEKTRTKMDAEKKVLNGLISDVRNIDAMHRSFSCSEVALAPTPSGGGKAALGSTRALGGGSGGPKAIAGSASAAALSNVAHRGPAAKSALVPRPSSGGRSQVLRSGPVAALGGGTAQSQSTPALMQFFSSKIAKPLSELELPARRAPPGCGAPSAAAPAGSQSLARRRQEAEATGRRGCTPEPLARFPSLSRTRIPKVDCIGA